MIRWTFRILINFTIGMFGAIVGFIFALPSVIHGFGASFFSFVFFFILAVITAISVVLTFLGLLYGGAIGGIQARGAGKEGGGGGYGARGCALTPARGPRDATLGNETVGFH